MHFLLYIIELSIEIDIVVWGKTVIEGFNKPLYDKKQAYNIIETSMFNITQNCVSIENYYTSGVDL